MKLFLIKIFGRTLPAAVGEVEVGEVCQRSSKFVKRVCELIHTQYTKHGSFIKVGPYVTMCLDE
jgi:hypothetical protein